MVKKIMAVVLMTFAINAYSDDWFQTQELLNIQRDQLDQQEEISRQLQDLNFQMEMNAINNDDAE